MEILCEPVRYSFHPGCDRFPDVFLAGSNLARNDGATTNDPGAPAGEPAPWPSHRAGLVYLFQTGDEPNPVPALDGRPERGYAIRPRGRARLDHDYALVLAAGLVLAEEANDDLLAACRKTNQLTVEAVLRPDRLDQSGPARIVTFSTDPNTRNYTLGQERDKLLFRLRTPRTGDNGVNPETTLGPIPDGRPIHVIVTYRPGLLAGYVDGREVYRGESVQGDWPAPQFLVQR
jgi:hypothetical protein